MSVTLFKIFIKADDGTLRAKYGDEVYEVGKTYTLDDRKRLSLGIWGYHGSPFPEDCKGFLYADDNQEIVLTRITVNKDKGIVSSDPSIIQAFQAACFREFTIDSIVDLDTVCGRYANLSGTIVRQYKNGKLHCDWGPAETAGTRSRKDGVVPYCESWYRDGELHRDGGPAITRLFPDRTVQEWYQNGRLHREDGPATQSIYKEDDHVFEQTWYWKGARHRKGGPAVISWEKSTRSGPWYKSFEAWYLDGVESRPSGGATNTLFYPSSGMSCEEWGVHSREVGKPYRILYYESGFKQTEIFPEGVTKVYEDNADAFPNAVITRLESDKIKKVFYKGRKPVREEVVTYLDPDGEDSDEEDPQMKRAK